MVRIVTALLAFFVTSTFVDAFAEETIIHNYSADKIENGCRLAFYAVDDPDSHPSLGRPIYSIDFKLDCDGKSPSVIDTYEVEGGSPEIVTVFYRKKRNVVVLVKWLTLSRAADYTGDYYKIYFYQFCPDCLHTPLIRNTGIMDKLGSGWEGYHLGKPVHFSLKNAASIQRALTELGH